MLVELNKKDLLFLVKGTSPSYNLFDDSVVKSCGTYSGSYDRWDWLDSSLNKLTESELWSLYVKCSNK